MIKRIAVAAFCFIKVLTVFGGMSNEGLRWRDCHEKRKQG